MQVENQDSKPTKKRADHLEPWRFQKGKVYNPQGRTKGKSLRTFAKEYLASLSDDEKLDYMHALDKVIVWQMAEGGIKRDVEVTGEVTSKIVRLDR